jgi:hypothetical protein
MASPVTGQVNIFSVSSMRAGEADKDALASLGHDGTPRMATVVRYATPEEQHTGEQHRRGAAESALPSPWAATSTAPPTPTAPRHTQEAAEHERQHQPDPWREPAARRLQSTAKSMLTVRAGTGACDRVGGDLRDRRSPPEAEERTDAALRHPLSGKGLEGQHWGLHASE